VIHIEQKLRSYWNDTAWPTIIDSLYHAIHNSNSKIILLSELDDIFFFNKRIEDSHCVKLLNEKENWIGISHQHREFLKSENLSNNVINKYLDKCFCIITLSEYMKKYWQSVFPKLKVARLFHPCPKRKNLFEFKSFLENPSVRSIGTWGRSYRIWDNLTSPYPKKLSSKDNYLSSNEFNRTFIDTIQFIDLLDASANNGVVECIRRNTPLLVNKHPAVVEYLGKDYPYYFESLEEANDKIKNINLVKETHNYLLNMNKSFIDIEFFIQSFIDILNELQETSSSEKKL
jgi:hypothetical protein